MSRPYDKLMKDAECNSYALAEEIYQLGRADQKEEDNAFFNFEGAWELEKKKVRAETIDEIKELAQQYLIGMMNLENATKYGNKNANQQNISYGTLMRYEIADCVDDFIDSIEQLKEQKMSCSLRNKCEALYCETCKVGADGRTNYKESEQYQQGRAEGRKEAILWVRKLIKIFWKDWNKTSHKKLPYLAFEELDEHILEQADESNGREFMQWYKEQNK